VFVKADKHVDDWSAMSLLFSNSSMFFDLNNFNIHVDTLSSALFNTVALVCKNPAATISMSLLLGDEA